MLQTLARCARPLSLAALAAWTTLGSGCERSEPRHRFAALGAGDPPPVTRLAVTLAGPLPVDADPSLEDASFHAEVQVPDGPWTGGEALWLSGVYGTATVSLDGDEVATVPPGPGPVEVPLPDLEPGAHAIDIALSRADTPPPMVRGGDRRATPLLVDGPVLLLRPRAHVRTLAVPFSDGKVFPQARVADAPSGATVRFLATLDGAVLADLGRAPVVDGLARVPGVEWTLPQWQVGNPSLYVLHALLEDADGHLLDAWGIRGSPRAVAMDREGFRVGGRTQRLVGWRSTPRTVAADNLPTLERTGANALEFHGSPPTREQLMMADETGIAVVLTPRCEGTFQTVPEAERAAIVDANVTRIRDQAIRHADDMATHPSVVLWVSETRTLTALTQALVDADVERRPVVGHDLTMENLTLGRPRTMAPFAGAWVGETCWEGPIGAIDEAVAAFGTALEEGVRGGILEHVESSERELHWAPLLVRFGLASFRVEGRRAPSRVRVSGMQAGEVAWIEAPWIPAEGVVSTGAEVSLGAWYAGAAEVVSGTDRVPVDLLPQVWSNRGPTGPVAGAARP